MKYLVIFVVALLAAASVSAQVSLGVKGGYVNSNIELNQSGGTGSPKNASALDNWLAGVYFDVPLYKQLYLQPGLNYINKGAKLSGEETAAPNAFTAGLTKLKLHYLELPVNVVYMIPLGSSRLALGGGPYAAYCVKGRYDLTVYNSGKQLQTNSRDVDFSSTGPNVSSSNFQLQRWDVGVNVMASLELSRYVTIGANYSWGLLDIDKTSQASMKNQYLGLTLGFIFNREDW
ncbi:porin family protein [Chitinophaga vietnamensis]|uniref:porin family protein n=1 Tax=Chitinophaga vietnamensis TaxID=2593957 RepID=UPI00117822FC|nr:porin family protein [Chitinophaga vietnamensis]